MDKDMRNLAIDFRLEVIFTFTDLVRRNKVTGSINTIYSLIQHTTKAKEYTSLVKQVEPFFKDWLPLFSKYPSVYTLLVSEKFYWKNYAIGLDGKVLNPLSNIFAIMCGFASISIYSTESVIVTHVTNDENLLNITMDNRLRCDKTSEDAEHGVAVYAYAESTGLVATAFGRHLIRVDCHKPWARIVSCNDNTIKPLGEILILEDLPLDEAEFYNTQDYLHNKKVKFYSRKLMLRFFGINATEVQVNDYIFTNQLPDEQYRNLRPTENDPNHYEGGCWIRPVLNSIYCTQNKDEEVSVIQAF